MGEANTLLNLGALETSLGAKSKALDFYNQSLSIWRAMGDSYGEAYSLLGLGKLHGESDENQKALDHYNQALALFRKVKHPEGKPSRSMAWDCFTPPRMRVGRRSAVIMKLCPSGGTLVTGAAKRRHWPTSRASSVTRAI